MFTQELKHNSIIYDISLAKDDFAKIGGALGRCDWRLGRLEDEGEGKKLNNYQTSKKIDLVLPKIYHAARHQRVACSFPPSTPRNPQGMNA